LNADDSTYPAGIAALPLHRSWTCSRNRIGRFLSWHCMINHWTTRRPTSLGFIAELWQQIMPQCVKSFICPIANPNSLTMQSSSEFEQTTTSGMPVIRLKFTQTGSVVSFQRMRDFEVYW